MSSFKVGDLVKCGNNGKQLSGIVMDVRRGVLGGSAMTGSGLRTEAKRDEILVASPTGDFYCWFDEDKVRAYK